ncbi:MAG: anaerobic ribonucleoside-triphosphate reductase activating protein [Aquificaceae bacterium]
MNIGGFQSFTLIDYPGKMACIVFTQGCDFRCPYCQNPELVLSKAKAVHQEEIFSFLWKRRDKLEGVVISGGEPTLQKDLEDFVKRIKDMGYLVKLDTNGHNPHVLERLIDLLDYIAMDVKAPLYKYEEVVGAKVDVKKIEESIRLIMERAKDYEFRTTVVKELLSEEDLLQIGSLIRGAKRYYLQRFSPRKILDPSYRQKTNYTEEELKGLALRLKEYVKECYVR